MEIENLKIAYLQIKQQHEEAKKQNNGPKMQQLQQAEENIKYKVNHLQQMQIQYQQHYQARVRMSQVAAAAQGSQNPNQVQAAAANNAAALQQYQQQSQLMEKSNYRQNYQALKYMHLQEYKTMYWQEQMREQTRNSKYSSNYDDDRIRKQAALLAAQQVKVQFAHDEQPIRRDVIIDYKMETKTINGQQHSDLNRQPAQKQQ